MLDIRYILTYFGPMIIPNIIITIVGLFIWAVLIRKKLISRNIISHNNDQHFWFILMAVFGIIVGYPALLLALVMGGGFGILFGITKIAAYIAEPPKKKIIEKTVGYREPAQVRE
jgi:uncharacterized iron-regulated membrane protein